MRPSGATSSASQVLTLLAFRAQKARTLTGEAGRAGDAGGGGGAALPRRVPLLASRRGYDCRQLHLSRGIYACVTATAALALLVQKHAC